MLNIAAYSNVDTEDSKVNKEIIVGGKERQCRGQECGDVWQATLGIKWWGVVETSKKELNLRLKGETNNQDEAWRSDCDS